MITKNPAAPVSVERWSDTLFYHAATAEPEIGTILVIKVDHIGDLILGLDALICLRAAFPRARIDLACAPWNIELATAFGLFDTIYSVAFFARRTEGGPLPFDPAMIADLQGRHWDLAIDLRVDPDTRVILRHVDATFKTGFESPDEAKLMTLALPHRVPGRDENNIGLHQTLLMLRLVRSTIDLFRRGEDARLLLLDRVAAPGVPAGIDLSPAAGSRLVVCNSSSGRAVKNWPAARYRRLIDWLVSGTDVAVLLIGGKDERDAAADIVAFCDSPHVISAVGQTTLGQAIGLIAQAVLYIGNDSGFTHVAARLGIPTVALFSGIDPTSMWASLGPYVTILKAPVPCSPCHILSIEDCIGGHACLLNISEAAVRAAVKRHLFADPRVTIAPQGRF